jgi:hypothetical protein
MSTRQKTWCWSSFRDMKITVFALGLIVMLAVAGFGQRTNVAKLKFNGVGLDSTYGQVVKALGKAVKDPKPTREECIGGREKMVEYRGATFYFMDGDSRTGKTFEVKSFEVTSAKYVVSGIKIGDPESVARRRLGTEFEKKSEEGIDVWSYEFTDQNSPGYTSIFFARGKVVKIASAYMVC